MNSEYIMPDGSPRYGIRTDERQEQQKQDARAYAAPGSAAEEASRVGMQAMYFASRVRRYRPWTRGMHPLTAELVDQFPDHFRDAGRIVEDKLGSAKTWHKRLVKDANSLRREIGDVTVRGALAALGIAAGYVAACIALVAVSAWTDVFSAVQAIALFILLRMTLFVAVKGVTNKVRGTHALRLTTVEREDLLLDIQLATFLEILDARGVEVPPATSYRVLSGFRDIQASAAVVADMKIA